MKWRRRGSRGGGYWKSMGSGEYGVVRVCSEVGKERVKGVGYWKRYVDWGGLVEWGFCGYRGGNGFVMG